MLSPSARTLANLFAARIKEIDLLAERGAPARNTTLALSSNIKEFGKDANALFESVVGIPSAYFASWIPGVPLPAMLAGKRRLTVDVTPETLIDFGASYNLSPNAFIAFAEAGVFAINIRNFDPQNPDAEKTLEAYAAADKHGFLPQLFARAARHVYFLATLRNYLFDPLFTDGSSLRSSFIEADDLKAAAAVADKLGPFSDIVRSSIFRNERPSLVAVRWHWAYAKATQRFSNKIDPAICGEIGKKFRLLTTGTSADPGAAYLDLAMRLRYAHLLTSAPISAAFGGLYNLLLDGETEFVQAVRFGARLADYDLVRDRVLDTIRSIQLGKLPFDIKQEIPLRYRSTLACAGVEVFVRYNDTSYLKHYEDETHQKQLIEYVVADDGLEASFVQFEAEIDALLVQNLPSVGAVAHLAAEFGAGAMARGQRLRKLTKLHQGIELPTANLISHPATPIYASDPKMINLLVRATRLGDNMSSIGGHDDVRRRTIWFPRIFRRPPH